MGSSPDTQGLPMTIPTHKRLLTSYLKPLLTPDTPWHIISVDFIVELPESDGHNVIMVVVDSLTKQAHFLPVNTC
jgi:hypothetical protein